MQRAHFALRRDIRDNLYMKKNVRLYWMPTCSTCQKADRWLKRRGVDVDEYHDLKDAPLSREEVAELASKVGSPVDLFSKRAVKYREMNLSERKLSDDEMLDLMAEEYTFIKRPVLMIGDKAVAGFFERSYLSFLDANFYEKKPR